MTVITKTIWKRSFGCIIAIFLVISVTSQNPKIDSLSKLLKTDKEDTTKVNHITDLLKLYVRQGDLNKARDHCSMALQLATKLKYNKGLGFTFMGLGIITNSSSKYDSALYYFREAANEGIKANYLKISADAHIWQGLIYYSQSDYLNAIENYQKAKEWYTKISYMEGIAMALGNIGIAYKDQGNYTMALALYIESLELAEKINDKKAIILANGNIGVVYYYIRNYTKAEEYYKKALAIAELENDKSSIALQTGNIGIIYSEMSDKKGLDPMIRDSLSNKALRYYLKALSLSEEINETTKIPNIHVNIANLHAIKNRFNEASKHYAMALDIATKNGFKHEVGSITENIGGFLMLQSKYKEAEGYLLEAAKIHHETGSINSEKTTHKQLSVLYELLKKFELAFFHQKIEMSLKDSIFNIEKNKEITQKELNYKFEKKQSEEKILHEKEISLAEADKKTQRGIILFISVLLVLVIVFLVYVFKTLNIRNKQKKVIEFQKLIVEEKHKEITDSINYAERIQRSFIATKEILDENLKNYFVLFKPKDVVSGDFYWVSKLNNGNFALVTADSTGHGVPGAIMSLLNITSLEKAIESLSEPSEILNATRKTIIERLKTDGSIDGGKDGMDASLLVFDFKKKRLHISAANNPVWLIRDGEIIEIKPDKMPVGKHDKDSIPFTQQTIELQSNDVIYAITDGFPDQFGGPLGKKFMSKNLKELLKSNSHLPMEEQKALLDSTFKNWVGDLEQVDDVTIVGVRV